MTESVTISLEHYKELEFYKKQHEFYQDIRKDLVEINDLIKNGDITKIFSYKDIKTTNNVQNLINTYPNSLEIINSNRIIVLNDEQRETETDYLTLMNQNLDNIREELYHNN